jgi:hypothetical protein
MTAALKRKRVESAGPASKERSQSSVQQSLQEPPRTPPATPLKPPVSKQAALPSTRRQPNLPLQGQHTPKQDKPKIGWGLTARPTVQSAANDAPRKTTLAAVTPRMCHTSSDVPSTEESKLLDAEAAEAAADEGDLQLGPSDATVRTSTYSPSTTRPEMAETESGMARVPADKNGP